MQVRYGAGMERVWSGYGAGMEQVRAWAVRKMREIRIKRKDNCYFDYEKKVYRGSGNMTLIF